MGTRRRDRTIGQYRILNVEVRSVRGDQAFAKILTRATYHNCGSHEGFVS